MKANSQTDIVDVPDVKYPRSGARFWHGMTTLNYLKLMVENRFQVSFLRWAMAIIISIVTIPNSLLVFLQTLFFERKIKQTHIEHAPIFVVGHWRSGTTLLHELLALDPHHAYPTTYECFAPRHFLLTQSWLSKILWFILPSKRPMDSMNVSFDAPQEDEFALVSMGSPSPYFRLAFPNHDPPYEEFYNMRDASPEDQTRFDNDLTYFFKALTFAKQERLILKSPTHTGRIEHLSRLFPNARFVHISREPQKLFSSTMQMWMIMDKIQGFQTPRYSQQQMFKYCLNVFREMYDEGYLDQVDQIPVENLVEIRFEDLIANPNVEIKKIYQRFGLASIDKMSEKVDEYFSQRTDYRANKHQLSEDVKQQLDVACASYIQRFGYHEGSVKAS